MIETVYKNYLKKSGIGPTFKITLDQPPTKFSSYFEETVRAAEIVWSQKQGRLHLLYSGGLDSEYALSVFLSLKMDVVPVIVRLLPNYNDHDTRYAIEFCQQKGLDPLIVDIDFDNFVKSGKMLIISKQIKACVYHYAATAYACSMLDGTVILGDGEPTLEYHNGGWKFVTQEHEYAVVNHFIQEDICGTPHFNRYTSEMMASFLLDPVIQYVTSLHDQMTTSSDRFKLQIYNKGNDFNLVQRPKYHGYETIANSDIMKHEDFKELKRIGMQFKGTSFLDYHTLVNKLTSCIDQV